jgi:hypothetical protein
MSEFDIEDFNIDEYNFFKNVITYDSLNNYDSIPDVLIEQKKEKIKWSQLIITLLKENRLNKDFLLKYDDYLGEREWSKISEKYNFDNKECELFLFKINWEKYLLNNNNVLDFEFLTSLNIFEKENCLLNYSSREDLFNQQINLNTLSTVLENYNEIDKKIIVGNFVCQCILDEKFINQFFEYINFDYLYYYQKLSSKFINENNNLFNLDNLIKYQFINTEDILYNNNRGIFRYIYKSPCEQVENKNLWINKDIYNKVKIGFYFDSDMDKPQDDLSSVSSLEKNENDEFLSYGFLVLDKNIDIKNFVEYSVNFKENDIILSNSYYDNYELDYEQFNRIPKVYIDNDNREYNNIVSNANKFSLFYGLKLMNYSETLECINEEEYNDTDLNIIMVKFNLNDSVLYDLSSVDLTSNKFTIIKTYNKESFNKNVSKDFKKYIINTYFISLEDSNTKEEELDLSIQDKVVSYLENTPDISFYSVEENFKKNPGYKNTTGNEIRLIKNNLEENKPNFIWRILGY